MRGSAFKELLLASALLLFVFQPARGQAAEADARRPDSSGEMTIEEGREARSLAFKFVRRLRETDDFAPLVAEFFPEDFERRIKQFIRDAPEDGGEEYQLNLPCDRALILRAEPGELRRAYVALMNFWNQQHMLHIAAREYAAVERAASGGGDDESGAREEEVAEGAVPVEAFRVAAADPLLDVMLGLVRARRGEGEDGEAESNPEEDKAKFDAAYIRDAARMRSFVEKLERCDALLREGVARLRSDSKSLAASHCVEDVLAAESARGGELKVYRLDGQTLKAPAFGMRAGALLIQARVYPYELAMTRAGGKLRIVAVYPDIDGD